jgi:hypothetical protein
MTSLVILALLARHNKFTAVKVLRVIKTIEIIKILDESLK